ncbi:MAG TPA: chemotaxis protein CheW [Ktedonobacteraceae bacterium]
MEEQRADNSGKGETGPIAGWGRFIVPIASAQRNEARFNPSARGQSLSQPYVSPQSLESISEEEFWNYAREQAKSISSNPTTEEVRPQQYLECRLSCGAFLIPLQALSEVVQPPHHYALLPNIPGWMLGITLWQGQVLAVIDLNAYLCDTGGCTDTSPSAGTLLVASNADLTLGLFLHPTMLIDKHVYNEQNMPSLPIIDMPMLLTDAVQQIGLAAYHG